MKTRIVYDASILAGGFRSGIFFAAWNILLALARRSDVEVWLYYAPTCSVLEIGKIEAEMRLQQGVSLYRLSGLSLTATGWASQLFCRADDRIRAGGTGGLRLLLLRLLRKVGYLFSEHRKPIRLRAQDVFLSPLNAIPSEFRGEPVKKFLILYDMMPTLFPQFYPPIEGSWYKEMLDSLNSGDRYFPISYATRDDFLRHCPAVSPEQMTVIPLAADERVFHRVADRAAVDEALGRYGVPTDAPYLLSLCSIDPRKNLVHMVKAFLQFVERSKIDRLNLVLVGGSYDKLHEPVRKELDRMAAQSGRIIMTGYVKDEDLSALYSGALYFLYVSLYEGFGLPPLEAMRCGCPVITSDNSSLPEVVGDAAICVAADDMEGLVTAMERLYSDAALRRAYVRKGAERVALFSWDRTVEIMVDEMRRGYIPLSKNSYEHVSFSQSSVFCSGFSVAEQEHIWSNARSARLKFANPDLTAGAKVRFWMEFMPFLAGEKCERQRVSILHNGRVVVEKTIDKPCVQQLSVEFEVAFENGRDVFVDLELPDATSPASVGAGPDVRELALAVRQLALTHV